MTERTPLFECHVAEDARMVDFGGWEMPLHYGSQLDEHHGVRRSAGMFDVSHMLSIDIEGDRSREFLRHLLANDVARLDRTGSALYSCLLNDEGGILDDLIVYRLGVDRYRAVVNAGTAPRDVTWFRTRAEHGDFPVRITPRRDLAMIAVQGPTAREAVFAVWPEARPPASTLERFEACEFRNALIARTGYTGEDGFEIALPADDAASFWKALRSVNVRACGLGARDTLRLEAGMNLYGADMDETVTPGESGLAWTVDQREERAFIGRTALEVRKPSGALVGLRLQERGVLRSHMRVRTATGDGIVTSGTFAPTLGFSIGLARLPLLEGRAPAPGNPVEVEVRDRWLPALVVKPPFVRNGRSMLGPQPVCG